MITVDPKHITGSISIDIQLEALEIIRQIEGIDNDLQYETLLENLPDWVFTTCPLEKTALALIGASELDDNEVMGELIKVLLKGVEWDFQREWLRNFAARLINELDTSSPKKDEH